MFNLILTELMAGIEDDVDDALGSFDMGDIMASIAMAEGEGDNPFIQFGMGGTPFMGRRGGGPIFSFGDDEDDEFDEDGEGEEDEEGRDGPFIEEVGDDDDLD